MHLKKPLLTLILLSLSGITHCQLSEHIASAVDYRIQGISSDVSHEVFLLQDHSTPNYIWNTNFWAYDINRDAVSPWNSESQHRRAGVLISPQHYILTKHYPIHSGNIIRFVKRDGTIIERTIIRTQSTERSDNYKQKLFPDINIGLLDAPIFDIEPIKILSVKHGQTLEYKNVPVLWFDQEEKGNIAHIHDIKMETITLTLTHPFNYTERFNYYERVVSGDSGSPVFVIINNKLILVCTLTYGEHGSGAFLGYFKDEIQSIMNSLSMQYGFEPFSIQEADVNHLIPPQILTDGVLGTIYKEGDYAYSFLLEKWLYFPTKNLSESGGWVYIFK